jgi:hypothetical protein
LWLVARDLEYVANISITDNLDRLYVPVNHDVPDMPISKDEAVSALLTKWREGAFDIHGRSTNGERVVVPQPRFPGARSGLTVVNGSLSIWVKEMPIAWDTSHWSHLWVKPAQIMACWKPKAMPPAPPAVQMIPAPPATVATPATHGQAKDIGNDAPRKGKPGSGNVPYASDAELVARALKGIETQKYKSANASAWAMVDEIDGGGSDESKARRLAAKSKRRRPQPIKGPADLAAW